MLRSDAVNDIKREAFAQLDTIYNALASDVPAADEKLREALLDAHEACVNVVKIAVGSIAYLADHTPDTRTPNTRIKYQNTNP